MADAEVKFRDFFEGIRYFAIHTISNPFTEFEKSVKGLHRIMGLCWNWCLFAINVGVLVGSVWYLYDCLQDDPKIYTISLPFAWILLYVYSLELTWILYIKFYKLVSILSRLDEMFPKTPTTIELSIIQTQFLSWTGINRMYKRIFSVTFAIIIIIPLSNATIGYVRNDEWTLVLPMFIKYPFDPLQPHLIGFVYLFEAFVLQQITSLYWLTLGILGATTSQMSIHFSILAEACRMLRPSPETSHDSKVLLKNLIEKHVQILTIFDEIRDWFSITLLLQFAFNSLIICLMVFMVIYAPDLSQHIYSLFCTICTISFNILVFHFAEEIAAKSTSISFAIYECDWFDADLEFKKLMLTMMCMSNKPCSLTGMGFFSLSFEILLKVIFRSYSYLMLLRSFNT